MGKAARTYGAGRRSIMLPIMTATFARRHEWCPGSGSLGHVRLSRGTSLPWLDLAQDHSPEGLSSSCEVSSNIVPYPNDISISFVSCVISSSSSIFYTVV